MPPTSTSRLPASGSACAVHPIELKLHDVSQLFNSLDPSPFNEQDLDHDAEEFIVSWAREIPRNRPLHLIVHLEVAPPAGKDGASITESIHHYFTYRASIARSDLRELLRQGRMSLLIGSLFLAVCLSLGRMIGARDAQAVWSIARESLSIGGWVAMWRPMEIYLYDWWPIRRRMALLQRLGRMKIDVKVP